MNQNLRPPRRKGRLLRYAVILLGVLLLVSVMGSLTASFPSVAYARDEAGSFERIAGGGSHRIGFHAGYTRSAASSDRGLLEPRSTGHPLQLSSLTILDVSGTNLSKQVAYRLMEKAKEMESMQRVDVRIPGSPLDVPRVGELLLIIEELDSKPGKWFDEWSATYRVFFGYKPPFGWLDPIDLMCPLNADWDITARARFFGSPLHRAGAVARVIADEVDFEDAIGTMSQTFESAPPVPAAALPDVLDLGSFAEVAAATKLEGPPLLSGVRLGRKGDALWRYLGHDACERIDAARETLQGNGWTVHGTGSRGSDGRTHSATLRRGYEFVEWTYQENREQALQPFSSSPPQPTGRNGTKLSPAIWIHYWHEQSKGELQASMLAAGPDKANALRCLPIHQRALLTGNPTVSPDK